jgi:hypothetical protein
LCADSEFGSESDLEALEDFDDGFGAAGGGRRVRKRDAGVVVLDAGEALEAEAAFVEIADVGDGCIGVGGADEDRGDWAEFLIERE